MELSYDDKRALVALIWSLKPSDLSVLQSGLREERGGLIGTTKFSANNIFYSKLKQLGLAGEVALKSDPEWKFHESVKDTKTFALIKERKPELLSLVEVALNSGDPPDEALISAEALGMLEQYANEGNGPSQNKLGILYEKGAGVVQDYGEALRWYRQAAGMGDIKATNNVGVMYFAGFGVPKSTDEALKWFLKAADLGSAGAMDNLGEMYLRGIGVPRDHSEALKWFLKAAGLGHGQASYKAGWLYSVGQGAPQDYVQAYLWLTLAVAARVNCAQYRDDIASKMTSEQIEQANLLLSQRKPASA